MSCAPRWRGGWAMHPLAAEAAHGPPAQSRRGLEHARIAGHLQVSERMVAKYIAGGLQQLRQLLALVRPA